MYGRSIWLYDSKHIRGPTILPSSEFDTHLNRSFLRPQPEINPLGNNSNYRLLWIRLNTWCTATLPITKAFTTSLLIWALPPSSAYPCYPAIYIFIPPSNQTQIDFSVRIATLRIGKSNCAFTQIGDVFWRDVPRHWDEEIILQHKMNRGGKTNRSTIRSYQENELQIQDTKQPKKQPNISTTRIYVAIFFLRFDICFFLFVSHSRLWNFRHMKLV